MQVAGFAVREYARQYSNFRATCSLDEYLKKNRVPAIEGIDTRKLTRHIRDKGALRGGIFLRQEEAVDRLKAHPQMNGLDLASKVMSGVRYNFGTHSADKPLIGVFDFGVKTNILRMLDAVGFSVRVYPGNTELKEVLSENVKGVFLSNGPGDPDAVGYGKTLVRDIAKESVPCFGICLGHQLIARGLGAKTYK